MTKEAKEQAKEHSIEITGLTAEGKGVGRLDGMAVFVSGALPGEVARVRILGKKKRYAWGEAVSIERKSRERVSPPCNLAPCCGGCPLSHLSDSGQLVAKADFIREQLSRIGGVTDPAPLPIMGAAETWGYRNRVYLHYQDGELGFFAPESKKVIPVSHCFLTTPAINNLIACLQRQKSALGGIRGLSHILIKESNVDGSCLVAFLCQGEGQDDMRERTVFLKESGLPIAGVWYNYGKKSPWDGYFSEEWQLLYGAEKLTVSLMGRAFRWGAKDFLQVNFTQTEQLYGVAGKLLASLPINVNYIWDIYCGVGTIGICLASSDQAVIGIEVVAEAVASARENAAANNVKGYYYAGLCEDVLPKLLAEGDFAGGERAAKSVAVLDPPRSGCEERVLDTIAAAGFPYIIYISCHGASLARDMKYLLAKGYAPEVIQPVDLFPQTGHVECVCLLSLQTKERR